MTDVERLADLIREASSGRGADRRGDLRAGGDPRLPIALARACGENVDPMEVAHFASFRRDPGALLALLRRPLPRARDKQPNGAHRALVELERRGHLDAVVTQNIDRLHRAAGTRSSSRSTGRSTTRRA
jgi:NAD-dependent deacetylase